MRKRLTVLALAATTAALVAGAGAPPAQAYCMEVGVAVDPGPLTTLPVPETPDTGLPTPHQCINMLPCQAHATAAATAAEYGIRLQPMYCLM
jgi:hypothetical protein